MLKIKPLIVLMAALAVVPAAAQEAECPPEILQGILEAAERAQDEAALDAQAAEDFNRGIKMPAVDFEWNCLEVAWPEMNINRYISDAMGIQETFLNNQADALVDRLCDQARQRVTDMSSVFSNRQFQPPQLPTLESLLSGIDLNLPPPPNVPWPPTGAAPPSNPPPAAAPPAGTGPAPAGFGGLIDLIKPRPNPNPGQGNPPPDGGDPRP